MIGLDCSAGCKYLDDDRLYHPRPAPFFRPRWIIKTAGSTDTPDRRRLVEGICAAYPDAEVIEDLDTPHNKIKVAGSDPVGRLRRGKRTLVLGRVSLGSVDRRGLARSPIRPLTAWSRRGGLLPCHSMVACRASYVPFVQPSMRALLPGLGVFAAWTCH